MRFEAGLIFALGFTACSTTPAGDESSAATSESESGAASDTESESESDTETGETGETGESESETGDTDDPPGNLLLSDQLLNIAHRGGGRLRPEATLMAFEQALEVGADILEMDVHASADGVVVVIHDDTVDRTTDGSGAVSELSFAELRMLDAGWSFTPDGGRSYPYRGMGVQIPSLDEVLEAFPDRYFLIEIKPSEPSIVPAVIEVLDAHELDDRVVLASFHQVTIDEVRTLAPELFTAFSFNEMVEFYGAMDSPSYMPPSLFVQPPWEVVNQELVDFAHSLGLKVHPWTINGKLLMKDLIELGVDGIMTDDPLLLGEVLDG
ncbi:MAG: glycerophosphodiester phosphodiesterase [Enhygromyxa sp.]